MQITDIVELAASYVEIIGMDTSMNTAWFGDAEGLEKWLSRVMIEDDEKVKETDTLVILPSKKISVQGGDTHLKMESSDLASNSASVDDSVDMDSLTSEATMKAASVSSITPVMTSEAKKAWVEMFCTRISPVPWSVGQARLEMEAEKIALGDVPDTPRSLTKGELASFYAFNHCRCTLLGLMDICGFCSSNFRKRAREELRMRGKAKREKTSMSEVRKTLFVSMESGFHDDDERWPEPLV